MTATRGQIVAEARSWIGTPFVHQGRVKGAGVDCAGVVEMVPKALGLYAGVTVGAYHRQPDPVAMRAALQAHLDPVPFRDLQPADVLWFRIELDPQHLAIVVDLQPLRIVHAFARQRVQAVIEQRVDRFWQQRIAGCWRYRGVH